jgi:hypothetical protein
VIATEQRRAQGLATELEESRAAKAATASALDRARALLERESRATAAGTTAPRLQAGAPMLAVVLLPQTRTIGPLPAIAVAPEADAVAFELRLDSTDFRRYQVTVRDPGTNAIVWHSSPLSPETLRGGRAVSIVVPASVFKSQHYAFELAGFDAAGRQEAVGSYAVEIDRY